LLSDVFLRKGEVLPYDRCYAITHSKTNTEEFSHAKPDWAERRNFAVMVRSKYNAAESTISLQYEGEDLCTFDPTDTNADSIINSAISKVVTSGQHGPFRFVSNPARNLTDDPRRAISLANTKSLTALSDAVGQDLDKRRVRCNVWFDGDEAWQENTWLGKTVQIGSVQLKVVDTLQRCAAIDADPELGTRNLPVLKTLNRTIGHNNFGVLAKVLNDGEIKCGDTLSVIAKEPT